MEEKENTTLLQDQKLACFADFLKYYHIDVSKFDFENYKRPEFRAHSIIFGIANRNKNLDLKENSIYNFLDAIKANGNFDSDDDDLSHADLIILNIASQLFDRQFKNRKLDNKNIQDIRRTIAWASDSYEVNQFTIFYAAYRNANLKTCQKLNNIFKKTLIKFAELVGNIKLLSAEFINSLPEEGYHQILDTIINSEYLYPPLEDDFYQKAGEIYKIKNDFFSDYDSFAPFFFPEIKDVWDVFRIEELVNMSKTELSYISGKTKEQLEKIKSYLELKVEPSKIDRLLCYPAIIQLGYKKMKVIRKQISNRCDSNKTLVKNTNN